MGFEGPVKSVDTNILARLILKDDARQEEVAKSIVKDGVKIPITVLLELGWLLQSKGGFDRARLNNILCELINSGWAYVDDEPAVLTALERHAAGADFADVLHLVAARGTEAFVTFDQGMPDAAEIGVDVERVG
jgi:predicted nucleic-acid-binding protein